MTGALIIARVLVRISAACRRRAGRILDEAVAWCDAKDVARRGSKVGTNVPN
jgi:hypothetical protein